MVIVVPVGAAPEGHPVAQAPREVVSRVSVNGLELAKGDPGDDSQQVDVDSEESNNQGRAYCAGTQEQRLPRARVLGRQAKGCGVGVVYAVHLAVHGTPVQETVGPVVVCVLEDEETDQLSGHGTPGWEGYLDIEPDELAQGVEEDDEGHLDEKVDEEDKPHCWAADDCFAS